MFKITIPKPLYVSGNKLSNDLLAMLAPAGATVEFVSDTGTGNETKTYSDGTTATGPAPLPETSPASSETPKRRPGRPRKEDAATAPAAQQTPPQAESAPTGASTDDGAVKEQPKADLVGGLDRGALLEEFTRLVDSDYDKAVEVLTSFNVQKFSELTDEQLPAFAAAMR